MSKTPHCVCSPNSLVIESPLKHLSNEMPSPPLPPRTLKANLSRTAATTTVSTDNKWEQSPDKQPGCNNDKIQCNCNRPHSCPADDSSPPIPPKCMAQTFNNAKFTTDKRFDDRLIYDQKSKCDTKPVKSHRTSRKSGRHNSSEGEKTQKKSRSKSRPTLPDDALHAIRPCHNDNAEEERYFMKNHDNLMEKNCGNFYKANKEIIDSNVNVKLCKISENNETNVNVCPTTRSVNHTQTFVQQRIQQPPDLIPNRSNSNKITQPTNVTVSDNCPKSTTKSRMKKFFAFLSKTKKTTTDPNRATTTTPDALTSLKITESVTDRPRRSKSLHHISSLSPTTSMHVKSRVDNTTDNKTKSSSIFAVISPTTTRLKRNLLCISPKTTVNANNDNTDHKKQACTLPVTGNSKRDFSDNNNNNNNNPQQRPGLSTVTNVRRSPVHLMAGTGSNNNESCCFDNESNLKPNHYNVTHFNCGNAGGDVCRGHKLRLEHQEKGNFNEIENVNKTSSGFKAHNQSNQETNQRKTPQSSNQISRQHQQQQQQQQLQQPVNNSTVNQMRSCYHYRANDNSCLCNNTYHHFCSPQSVVPSCGCTHNIVQINPNHFHCCHGNQQQLWCLVRCCSEQLPNNQHSFYSCQTHHHNIHQSASPPLANYPRQQLPLPLPVALPPPVPSFSNNHQFSRRYQQSYSKTPPPSFHTHHQRPCYDDHWYQEYSLNQLADTRQKMIISHQMKSPNMCHSNCCSGFQNKQCSLSNHSKCLACGSLFYDELSSQATHYNINDMHKNHCSSTPMSDSVFEHALLPKSRMFASMINSDDSFNCRCLYNHHNHRHSETCGRHSNEARNHSCRNSAHRTLIQPNGVVDKERSSSKRRKHSSHSYHGSNLDPDPEENTHELSRSHHNPTAAASNMLASTSIQMSAELNISCDMSQSANNTSNNQNNINHIMTSSAAIIQNDRKQQHFEPWRKTFHDNMMALRNLGWYWGPLNHVEAESLVQGRPDGTFLVRDSGNEAYFLSLTFRVLGTTYHTRIEYSQGKFSFWSQPESHSATTIVEFIDKAVAHSVSGKFHYFLQTNTPGQPPMEVSLLYPLSRYQIVQSLQHLSRFVILSNIRRDHVVQLELPQSIQSYLMEKQYYIDHIEAFVNITKNAEPLTYESSGRTL